MMEFKLKYYQQDYATQQMQQPDNSPCEDKVKAKSN
jgi:hypothetical protein